MPMRWDDLTTKAPDQTGAFCFAAGDGPALRLALWPHRSLPALGFVWFIGITAAMFLIPLASVLGTAALWVLLPHLLGTLALTQYALRRSSSDAQHEVLCLWDDHVELIRHTPRRADQQWSANPHWVQVELHPDDGPVENYVTLRGNNRTVEIGAFLSPDERQELYNSLQEWRNSLRI